VTRIARGPVEASGFGPSAVAIGVFDGVHAGHQALLRTTVDVARELGAKASVLTFDPHPACVVAPHRAPRLLYSVEERCELISQCGIEEILVLPFTRAVARLTPEAFAKSLLTDVLATRAVVIGDNFRFGHKQTGNADTLRELGTRLGFETRVVQAVGIRRCVVSASEIRRQVEGGAVAIATRLLARPYALSGSVVSGHGIGSKQTVPTLNLDTRAQVLPKRGVYITRTQDLDAPRRWNSITNIGVRPTFGGDDTLSIETFLLGKLEGATPAHIRVEFLRRVRDERKFENPEALKAQIFRDVGRAQAFFRRVARWVR
jgi:riboflavin kinase/FMN adenylyltransferase